jgi:hypothetical protein
MARVIHVRDVARGFAHDLGPEHRALRVPYDIFHPEGAIRVNEADVEWVEGRLARRGRFAETVLGDCHPGERVVVLLMAVAGENEWWLCDIESVDGVAAD